MSLDMTFNGSLGGSSGLLDWGSDIARMWGIGMQNGARENVWCVAVKTNYDVRILASSIA